MGLLFSPWFWVAIVVGLLGAYAYGRWTGYSNEHVKRLEERANWEAVVLAANSKTEAVQKQFSAALDQATRELAANQKTLIALEEKNGKLYRQNRELLKRIRVPPVTTGLLDGASGNSQPTPPKGEAEAGNNGTTGVPNVLQPDTRRDTGLDEVVAVEMQNRAKQLRGIAKINALQAVVCGIFKADGQPLEYEACQN